ncbi:hypothetical protein METBISCDRAFT_21012 [Metschnikowia bicuspidata]|uniref:Uncharacterized protein n=1 Tax=Metschnikowia bicuspidata TaxID=27322 RepID=A0A4P9ZHV1_9ASCO|nr:hypothetical protein METBISCDRAFT_21012 [Metschnikowia bicuspidata]
MKLTPLRATPVENGKGHLAMVEFGYVNELDYMLTASWEWLFLIQQAEQRIELSGMLGRRISVDDVRNFNTDWSQNGPGKKYPFMTWLREKFQHEKNIQDSSEERAYSHLDNVTGEVELRPLPSIRSRND